MKPKTVVILLVLLAIAGIAFVLLPGETPDRTPGPRQDDPENSGKPILPPATLAPGLIQLSLDLDGEGDDLVFTRVQGKWKIDHPHQFPAKTSEIDKVLNALAVLSGTPTDDQAISSHPLGITINHGEKRYSVWLGKRIGSGQAVVYLQTRDKLQGFVTTDTLHDLLAGLSPDQFFAKSFTPLLMPEVRAIHIRTPESATTLRQEDDHWQIAYDDKTERALAQSIPEYFGIQRYFDLFRKIDLLEQHPYLGKQGLAQFGLDRPLITVRFVPMPEDAGALGSVDSGWVLNVGVPADPQDKTRFISFGRSDDPTPPVFSVETPYALAFAQDASAFRDPRIVATPGTLIASIQLKFADASSRAIELPSGKKPVLRESNDDRHELSIDRVSVAVKQLTDARAMQYVPTRLSEWDELLSVRITPRLGGEPEVFTVYPDPETDETSPTVLVHRGKEPVALRVSRQAIAGLLDPESLWDSPR